MNEIEISKYLNRKTVIIFSIVIIVFVIIGITPSNQVLHHLLERYTKVFGLLSSISITIGVIGLIIANLTREDAFINNQFNITYNLMSKYTQLLPDLLKIENGAITDDSSRRLILLQYYNLSEEQLHHISKGLIEEEISFKWIDGIKQQMINFKDIQDQSKSDDGDIMEDYINEYIDKEEYALLNLLWSEYQLKKEITNKELKKLIVNRLNN